MKNWRLGEVAGNGKTLTMNMNKLIEIEKLSSISVGIESKISEKQRDILELEAKPIGTKEYALRLQLQIGIAELEHLKKDLDGLLGNARARQSNRFKNPSMWGAVVNRMNNPVSDFKKLFEDEPNDRSNGD